MASTPKAQALGVALRRAREKHGLTTRELAARIGRNQGEISRWETGDRTPKPEHVAQFLTALSIIGDPYDEVMSLAQDPTAPLWVAASSPARAQQLAAFIEIERNAAAIIQVLPSLIPGLLQTYDYAHAIMSRGYSSTDEIITRVAIRMGRQEAITRANPIQLTAFVGEAAIYQTIGSRAIMVEQLKQVLTMTERPNVTVRIMPVDSDWHPGLEAPFVFIQPAKSPPIVHLELRRSLTFLHEEDVVSDYMAALDMINKVALTPETSTRLIVDRMEKLSRQQLSGGASRTETPGARAGQSCE